MNLPETHTDEELFELIRRDDRAAFESLYNRHWERLFNAAYKRVRQKELCEEMVQEVFIGVWEKRNTLLLHSGLLHYLQSAVKYKVIDYYRKAVIRRNYLELNRESPVYHNAVEEAVFLNDLKAHLEKAVMQLPDKCRSIYQLSRFEHKSNREIALMMNISEKTVEGHLTKAIRALRFAAGKAVTIIVIL